MYTPGMWELLIILLIVMLVFGTGKLATAGKSLGTAIREFKTSVKDDRKPEEEEPVVKNEAAE